MEGDSVGHVKDNNNGFLRFVGMFILAVFLSSLKLVHRRLQLLLFCLQECRIHLVYYCRLGLIVGVGVEESFY